MQRISFISRQARRPELRALVLGASCLLFLGAQGNCGQGSKTTIAPISITINDIDNNPDIATMTQVTRIDNKGSCGYRLEFMAPGDKTRGINEIGGNRPGGAQRINSCTAFPPAFAATSTSNPAWFDEQSTYYWAKKSRDYATDALWITPPGVNVLFHSRHCRGQPLSARRRRIRGGVQRARLSVLRMHAVLAGPESKDLHLGG